MKITQHFADGLISVLKIIGAPMLYRYPYRTSAEALRSDWLNIAKDIETVMGTLEKETRHGRRFKK